MAKDLTVRELHSVRNKMWDASMQNHLRYIDAETGEFQSKFLEERICPVCKKNNERQLFRKSGGQYVTCTSCDLVYLNPVFKDEYLVEYYTSNHDLQSQIVSSDNEFYRRLYSKGLDAIFKISKNKGKILDVGCSAGIFLDLAKENSWETYGIELNKIEANVSRKKGHEVYETLIENLDKNEFFDAITLWDVFEHIKDGESLLKKAKSLLKKNGVLFIQSPSRDSLAARIIQEKCNMFDGLEHVNLYGKHSMQEIAKQSGFKVANYETVISEIGVINNYINYENPYMGTTNNKESILNKIDEKWLLENELGYKFQICLEQI